MEILKVAQEIEKKITQLEKGRAMLDNAARDKAVAMSEYDKQLAITIVKLKEEYPITLCEKIAKGEIYKARYQMDVTESNYKSIITKIDCLKAELNGWQSIYRYLSEV